MSEPTGAPDRDLSAYTVYEALVRHGWDSTDAEALWRRVQRLARGLPAEDEFCAILSWLGRCRLVHRLDQRVFPTGAQDTFRVPDLFAIFERHGHDIPVLIEVKTSSTPTLSWKPGYLESLRRYADTMGLPLLIAWKPAVTRMWTLVDVARFRLARVNYQLSWQTAMMGNLLGYLAGDFVVSLAPGVGMHFELKHEQTVSMVKTESGAVEEAVLSVQDIYLTNKDNQRSSSMSQALWALFLSTELEDWTDVSNETFTHHFVVPEERLGTWAHKSLVTMLNLFHGVDTNMNPSQWSTILERHTFPFASGDLRDEAITGIDRGLVRYVFDIRPDQMPSFLGSNAK
jgi:Holliday junction resolvase